MSLWTDWVDSQAGRSCSCPMVTLFPSSVRRIQANFHTVTAEHVKLWEEEPSLSTKSWTSTTWSLQKAHWVNTSTLETQVGYSFHNSIEIMVTNFEKETRSSVTTAQTVLLTPTTTRRWWAKSLWCEPFCWRVETTSLQELSFTANSVFLGLRRLQLHSRLLLLRRWLVTGKMVGDWSWDLVGYDVCAGLNRNEQKN